MLVDFLLSMEGDNQVQHWSKSTPRNSGLHLSSFEVELKYVYVFVFVVLCKVLNTNDTSNQGGSL